MEDRWLTYQQAGDLLGVSAEAIRRHARRRSWRIQRGNDGKALVLVPSTAASEGWARPDGRLDNARAGSPDGQAPGRPPGQSGGAATVADTMAALVADLRAAEADATQLRREVNELRERNARLEGELNGQREIARRTDAAVAEASRREAAATEAARLAQERALKAEAEAATESAARQAAEVAAASERQARIAAEVREAEAAALTRQVVNQLDATHRERVEAQAQAVGLRHHLDRAEAARDGARTEAAVLRDAEARAAAQVTMERTARQGAEVERDAAQAKLAEAAAGGPLARAWRALVYRRGRA